MKLMLLKSIQNDHNIYPACQHMCLVIKNSFKKYEINYMEEKLEGLMEF